MARVFYTFERVDRQITGWLARYSIPLLRIGLGIVFLWFGLLKFFPGLSPAQDLATRTISDLTFGLVPAAVSLPVLALWEVVIGLGLILGWQIRLTLLLLWVQMLGTVTPLFLYPGEVFTLTPIAPTLEGQYIIKNVVLICAGLVIGATARGGGVVPEPQRV
ncbi:MAG: DoxX family protein [Roseiflexaceae bacterium]|nr:DoxX family protein [Roseiflexaceae bacterium]